MGGQGSGRWPKGSTAADRRESLSLELPDMGATEDSIGTYCEAVARALASGAIDVPKRAEVLIAAAKAKLQALRQKHARGELDEMRALVEEAKRQNALRQGLEVEERYRGKKA